MQGGIQCVPGEGGTFDARGVFAHARQYFQFADAVRDGVLGGGDVVEVAVELAEFFDGFATRKVGHEGRAGFGDGAAVADEADVGELVAVHAYIDFEVVAAERVVPGGAVVAGVKRVEVARVFAVVEDDFLVEVFQFVHVKSSWVARTAATRRAMSSWSL